MSETAPIGSHALWLEWAHVAIGATPKMSLLDVCCGGCAVTRHLGFPFHTGIDLIDNPERPAEVKFIQGDACEIVAKLPPKSFDVAVISDGIEHLTEDQGVDLLYRMGLAATRVIVFAPDDSQIDPTSTDPHTHKSHWTTKDWGEPWKFRHFPDWHGSFGAVMAWR